MIYFTKALDYAVRALVCMARHPHESMDVKTIARSEGLPEVFLAKLLQKLKKAGFISSKRGISGGFVLEINPVNISIMDVIEAVEGMDKMVCGLEKGSHLAEKRIWGELSSYIEKHLRGVTVARLVADTESWY